MEKSFDRKSRPQVVLVIRGLVTNKKGEILLLKRSSKDPRKSNRGKWELPGGKLDIGQDISNALEREVLEETGLVVIPTDKLFSWHSEMLTKGKYKNFAYVVLTGVVKNVGGKVKLSEEHEDFKWVALEESFDLDLVHETRAAISILENKLNE